jgi:hypothetical protein
VSWDYNYTPSSARLTVVYIYKGVRNFVKEQQQLPQEEHYVRRIDESDLGLVIVCMFPEQSRRLQEVTVLQIDTTFKRVSPRKEFEIATYCQTRKRCKY